MSQNAFISLQVHDLRIIIIYHVLLTDHIYLSIQTSEVLVKIRPIKRRLGVWTGRCFIRQRVTVCLLKWKHKYQGEKNVALHSEILAWYEFLTAKFGKFRTLIKRHLLYDETYPFLQYFALLLLAFYPKL